MIVSIGMLAWNEEAGIAKTIRSLFQQSVFSEPSHDLPVDEWELVVVPNGCSDGTARVAAAAIDRCLKDVHQVKVSGSVVEVAEPGKSNAWNRYIHEFCRRDADLIVMVDSDIEFGHPETIYNCLKLLLGRPDCSVVVDKPLKDFARKPDPSFIEKLSLRFSENTFERDPAIAGSFYCARAEVLRNIWMPKGLSGEDGFLKAMVVTDCFRSEVVSSRVARAENASHFYEGLSAPAAIFRHELRMVIGTTLNCYFNWDFLRFATDPDGPGAGILIRNWLAKDPDWYAKYIRNEIANRGWWVLPNGLLFRRFADLGRRTLARRLARLPLATAAFLFDLSVFLVANRRLKKGGAVGFW